VTPAGSKTVMFGYVFGVHREREKKKKKEKKGKKKGKGWLPLAGRLRTVRRDFGGHFREKKKKGGRGEKERGERGKEGKGGGAAAPAHSHPTVPVHVVQNRLGPCSKSVYPQGEEKKERGRKEKRVKMRDRHRSGLGVVVLTDCRSQHRRPPY